MKIQTTPVSSFTALAHVHRDAAWGPDSRTVSTLALTDVTKPACAHTGSTITNRRQARRPPETPM